MLKREDLEGNWLSPEIETIKNPDGSVMYIKREAIFIDDNWDIFIRAFLDEMGEKPFFTIHAKGNYILAAESFELSGAVNVDFNNRARYVTAHQQSMVDMLNETNSFDGEWIIDLEHDVSLNGCVLVPSIETCPVEYDVIKIQDNKIYFGDFTAEQKEDIKRFTHGNNNPSKGSDGICSPDNRPRQLINYPMIRINKK
jgi:Adenomatosis polyposis coli down-regulated 1